jgi:hypothetical protein
MKRLIFTILFLIVIFNSCSSNSELLKISINNNNIPKDKLDFLELNGFYLEKTEYKNPFNLYKQLDKNNEPMLITVDLPLYSMHLIFDYTLRELEMNSLYDSLKILTETMYKISYTNYKEANDPKIKKIHRLISLYFAVPLLYLDTNFLPPPDLNELIESEHELIEAHKGFSISPVFTYKEDYSQYYPRGHYTINEKLKRYFKAFMWYGRIGFYFSPDKILTGKSNSEELAINMVKSSVIIYSTIEDNKRLKAIWNYINNITEFYVGISDDLTLNYYNTLTIPKDINNDMLIMEFIDEVVNKAPEPKIASTLKSDLEKDNRKLLCFKLLGQKYIPDSYIFQKLVYNNVGIYLGPKGISPFTIGSGKIRSLPMGLDVAAVLGSKTAKKILDSSYNSSYRDYKKNFNELSYEFKSIGPTNGYFRFLRIMKIILTRNSYKNDPIYMKSKLWAKKILSSVLSFWTMLRHDTILYAKQSYTAKVTSMPPLEDITYIAYLSPYGHAYKEMYYFISDIDVLLSNDKNVHKNWKYKLDEAKKLLKLYISISNKEMNKKSLSKDEIKLLYKSWNKWENITRAPYLGNNHYIEEESEMSIVADVHTDPNSKYVLEEAVGTPFLINAIIKYNGNNIIVKGASNSYYEFKYPMKDRLTDEKWREIMDNLPLPIWEEEMIH